MANNLSWDEFITLKASELQSVFSRAILSGGINVHRESIRNIGKEIDEAFGMDAMIAVSMKVSANIPVARSTLAVM